MVDNGYDIEDYLQVDPIFGSLDDFKKLIDTFKAKNIKVVIDFVPNHTSDQHEWFQKSRQKIHPYTDYYVWKSAEYGNTGCEVLNEGIRFLKCFWLKINSNQMKSLNFLNWCNGMVSKKANI